MNGLMVAAISDGKPVSTFPENVPGVTLRPYVETDEAATIALWQRTWQLAYPQLDFAARVDWWRDRWRKELVPAAEIMIAELNGGLAGFVTVDASGYLDQIVVAPEAWGSNVAVALIDAAKRISPTRLDLLVNQDNARAIRFYQKHGFAIAGLDTNPRSGAPLYRMSWRPE
ncbi:MAG TPA: GNAT family N-acetyltransferase [Burkholderiales bacterium]|nr:GNAT family N-acetyltransferase [Burkholderiales bacterium]